MAKIQILFVDDEPSVLAGIRRLLRRHQREWDLYCAPGGAEALELLARQPIDILVTDMRMPGTDGAQLLQQARDLYPAVARLVLSGHADHDAIVAAAGPTQRFLSKPCDPDQLETAFQATIQTLQLMDDPRLKELMGRQQSLPKPPSVYAELTALTADPQVTIGDIAALIERDLATTTEVLKLVNSSFFGQAGTITSVKRAVALLGPNVIRALVLAGHVFTSPTVLPPELDAHRLTEEALGACLIARALARTENWDDATVEQVGLAALLHDVGLLVLAADNPQGWRSLITAGRDPSARSHQLEAFGCTVGRASAYLLGLWGFTPLIVGALAEQPLDLDDPDLLEPASPAVVLVALAHRAAKGESLPSPAGDHGYLTSDRLAAWAAAVSSVTG